MDQNLVAAIALFAFSIFAVFAYIFREERKSRIVIEEPQDAVQDNIEKRVRRAF